ncbi:hypothetical protein BFP72_13120 [Reichenbachiella sp. 5M10]|uniref:hypothetical protein n=1 Tax=Reichenbachiella sp. 5M10 TaxID=1889772 RepID=UPI000C411534|nr:hypothetical protein [Reichenbachiella sp. 5M10]PIB36264.1 hypothetical protein BFP72_13120 [Reichenbachiella sp. 5M10]
MKHIYLMIIAVMLVHTSQGQNSTGSRTDVTVDANGIMHWPDQTEVQGFGVNYTVPFAHAYRTAMRQGVDIKAEIDKDVYHFARLGFDAYRVHVWDTEICDSLGNLIENEHLELFDYMLMKMKERNMKFLITPIAFWDNGWPEPAEKTPGFANKYGKEDCLTHPDAIEAQANYLYQFLNHVNPYTGVAYKDDPDIVAFEVSNEPHHDESIEKVTAFVSKMVQAMKKTGCQKPIFYNVSHSIHLEDAYYAAGIDGGTFQWYPTGLGSGEEIGGNLLPNVDNYDIPFKAHEGFKKGAKVVYEFDAADVGRSYIYPAMARSFRTAGIQWATHFAYDPTYMAANNTEYDTHYMNLVYAPQKALSLKICSEVFHQVPVYADYGAYPANASFEAFRVSYEEDLAEMVTEDKFYYTNHTSTLPSNTKKLKEIAGFGNSAVVQYEGRGAYFLDQLEKGVWRLEVMPDAVWIDNLFGTNSPDKKLADIVWNTWPMTVQLPDLGKDFSIQGINTGNAVSGKAEGQTVAVSPGTYLISRKGKAVKWSAADTYKNIRLGEYTAPATTLEGTVVLHSATQEVTAGTALEIEAEVVSASAPASVKILPNTWGAKTYDMQRTAGYSYAVTVPAEAVKAGYFSYYLLVETEEETKTYPAGVMGAPKDWDFYQEATYTTRVVGEDSDLYLFDAARDFEELNWVWSSDVALLPSAEPAKSTLTLDMEQLPTNEDKSLMTDYSVRSYFGDVIGARAAALAGYTQLVLRGSSQRDTPVTVTLIGEDGSSFGATVTLGAEAKDYSLALADLKPTQLVTLPRPYPGFLPYYFERSAVVEQLDISRIESIQISIGGQETYQYSIESIRLTK